jgi:hypothetical protein
MGISCYFQSTVFKYLLRDDLLVFCFSSITSISIWFYLLMEKTFRYVEKGMSNHYAKNE